MSDNNKQAVKVAVSARLKGERERLRYTQDSFAKALGVPKPTYLKWEYGANSLPRTMHQALERAGVDIVYVETGTRRTETQASAVAEQHAAYGVENPKRSENVSPSDYYVLFGELKQAKWQLTEYNERIAAILERCEKMKGTENLTKLPGAGPPSAFPRNDAHDHTGVSVRRAAEKPLGR